MAPVLLQKSRQRKMMYFGAIVALFTMSLVHREFVVKPMAMMLQLRETARGEVELTGSAVRLMLTGSRGLAVTMLWYTAMDKQRRGEYNELELIVKSITTLQPYFITPWLYQSWNISFNVAVECDRPRDKYYYISRGLELLAEGERRNSGTSGKALASDPGRPEVPGNPELRHFMGTIYQLKIGNSDEYTIMRCLLEMSCIDPVQRNPDRFLTSNERGQRIVKISELKDFTEKYPRLIRRLHEQLGYSDATIVQFLEEHKDIPNRFKPIEKSKSGKIQESELKDPVAQFPILPPHQKDWPDPATRALTSKVVDVFLVSRAWYEYAQQPLPPPDPNPTAELPQYDKFKYRVPKTMVIQLFRKTPARSQVFIAETLESEGFFDADGWNASRVFAKWLKVSEVDPASYTFGRERKYHSQLAWQNGWGMYYQYGIENGIYLSPADLVKYNQQAEMVRRLMGVKPTERVDVIAPRFLESLPEQTKAELEESRKAHMKLYHSNSLRSISNFDTFLYQSEGESDSITVGARKALFHAERMHKSSALVLVLEKYQQGWDAFIHACLKYPRFAQVSSMQEDTYKIHQEFLREEQEINIASLPNRKRFREAAFLAGSFIWPEPNWLQTASRQVMIKKFQTDNPELSKVVPIPKRYGLLDRVQYFDEPSAKEMKTAIYVASLVGLGSSAGITSAPQSAWESFAGTLALDHQYYYLMRVADSFTREVPPGWRLLITDETRRIVALRLDK